MAPAGLEGSGGGSHPGGLLNHDPVGIRPRLTSFPKYKCRESSCPTINSNGLCHWAGLFWDELSSLSYLPSRAMLPGGHPNRADQVFCSQWFLIFTSSTKKEYSDMSHRRDNMGANHKGYTTISYSVFCGPLHQLHGRTGKEADLWARFGLLGTEPRNVILNKVPGRFIHCSLD